MHNFDTVKGLLRDLRTAARMLRALGLRRPHSQAKIVWKSRMRQEHRGLQKWDCWNGRAKGCLEQESDSFSISQWVDVKKKTIFMSFLQSHFLVQLPY